MRRKSEILDETSLKITVSREVGFETRFLKKRRFANTLFGIIRKHFQINFEL